MKTFFLTTLSLFFILSNNAQFTHKPSKPKRTKTFYISNDGNDNYTGLNSEITGQVINGQRVGPWKTIHKVNTTSFSDSAVFNFKRGDVWREQLIAQSSATYQAYDDGIEEDKPLFLGSIKGNERRWKDEGNDIWSIPITTPDNIELISNSSFDDGLQDWCFWTQGGANATNTSSNSTAEIVCSSTGNHSKNNIQFFIGGINIQENTQYRLTFKAKSNNAIGPMFIKLMANYYPYPQYSENEGIFTIDNTEWKDYVYYFDSNTLSSAARITFYLGEVTNANWILNLDEISLQKMVIPTYRREELISNSSFDTGLQNWYLHTQGGALATKSHSNSAAKITCTNSGTNSKNNIQFYTKGVKIQNSTKYRLTFKAKSIDGDKIDPMYIKLMKFGSPWTQYSQDVGILTIDDTEWNSYVFYFDSDYNDENARITFYLGGTGNNWELLLDDISIKKTYTDVGNIIFNTSENESEYNFGIKRDSLYKVDSINKFFTDRINSKLYFFKDYNPETIDDFEIALTRDIINQKFEDDVGYHNLALKYGGTMGIGCEYVARTNISDCNMSYIGGGYHAGRINGKYVRLGNAIQFWGKGIDIVVERNNIHQIYDTGVTNQMGGDSGFFSNIKYRNNLISNCEMSFEHWNNPDINNLENSLSDNIYFVNNTCLYAGETWADGQRPDGNIARHLRIGKDSPNENAEQYKVFIRNNILYESDFTFISIDNEYSLKSVNFQNNLYYDSDVPTLQPLIFIHIIKPFVPNVWCTEGTFDFLNPNFFYFKKSDCTNDEKHLCYDDFIDYYDNEIDSLHSNFNALLNNPAFHHNLPNLNPWSTCLEYGVESPESGDLDFFGNPRIKGTYIDIGCAEWQGNRTRNPAVATRANTLHDMGIEGQGMTMYLWDNSTANTEHDEYDTRYTIYNDDQNLGSHGSMSTGVIMSKGIFPIAKGVAPQSNVIGKYTEGLDLYENGIIVTPAEDIAQVQDALNTDLVLVSSNFYGDYNNSDTSWQDWKTGAYLNISKEWDDLMYDNPYYLMVTAAGNNGIWDSNYNSLPLDTNIHFDRLTGNKTAKNNIVVANLDGLDIRKEGNDWKMFFGGPNVYTSQGPTDDYRIKPDIAGLGKVFSTDTTKSRYTTANGTSMSTPGVAGTLLLLQQYYESKNSDYMKAATLKGLALHTADDIHTYNHSIVGPDAITGWGLLNAQEAAKAITNNNDTAKIIEGTLDTANPQYITSVSSYGNLKVSISWTDPSGTVSTTANDPTPVLVNDLDLRVKKDGIDFFPYTLTSVEANSNEFDNNVDPFERIDIPNAQGEYTIEVTHKNPLVNGEQKFSLIITGIGEGKDNGKGTLEKSFVDSSFIIIYPNPSNDFIALTSVKNMFSWSIYNLQNEKILTSNLNKSNIKKTEINVSKLPVGIYLIKVTFIDGKTAINTIIKE